MVGWVWYLIVSTPDLCTLTYFYNHNYLKQYYLKIISTILFENYNLWVIIFK